MLTETLREQIEHRFAHMMKLRDHDPHDAAKARAYVEAMLGLQVYPHNLNGAIGGRPRGPFR